MTPETEQQLEELLAFVQAAGRVCPLPTRWNELWELLPHRKRRGVAGWDPPLPLILGAWHFASDLEKQARLAEHLRYGAEQGVLDQLERFLRGLGPDEWLRGEAQ